MTRTNDPHPSGPRRWGPALAGALTLWAGAVAYRAAARRFLRLAITRLNAGDPRLVLATFAKDAVLIFPGRNSWAGEHRGKEAIRDFLERFIANGIKLSPESIDLSGPPWATRVHLGIRDLAVDEHGRPVYENVGVIVLRLRWGRIVEQRDHEITENAADFDRWLAAHGDERSQAFLAASHPKDAVATG